MLRKKPPGQLLKSAHAVDREYRVMKGLENTDVPVPRMVQLCEDDSVIGTAFFVMEFVDGTVFWDPALPELTKAQRAKVYDEKNRALAALHSVDPAGWAWPTSARPAATSPASATAGPSSTAPPRPSTWPTWSRLIAWLETNEPPDDGRVTLVHGDYRLDNMIFAHDASRLLAVIDWELSTLGHPFSDLAYQCMQWRLPNHEAMRGLATSTKLLGMPTEAEYIATYCRRMGSPGSRTGSSAWPSASSAWLLSSRA